MPAMMLRAALLLVSAMARSFPESPCRNVARNPATPAKAIEEACKQEMALSGGQCEFFSEAWGLAVTHPGYSSETFCGAVAAEAIEEVKGPPCDKRYSWGLVFGDSELKPEAPIL